MSSFIIEQSPPLHGTVRIGGSKNAVLPILAATLLTPHTCVIQDVPALTDVFAMQNMIEDFGGQTRWDAQTETMTVTAAQIGKQEASYDLAAQMRASFLVMGPVLARCGCIKAPLPGGCAIGSRPVDQHLKGFAALGADITQEHGYILATAKHLTGATIYLDFPSVGATENIIMAAVLAEGQTILQNCANEPEIVDLANFLTSIGADIRGAGTDTIRINGVRELGGSTHAVIPDRIEAGTFMLAAAATHGDIILENIVGDHLKAIAAKLREANILVEDHDNGLHVYGSSAAHAVDVKTLPYPGFPTDMQAQFMGFLATTAGSGIVIETVFENRFMHVSELKRMGADIKIDSRSAVVEGVPRLTGTQVRATDLRAGAALVVAGLSAEGTTEVRDIYHIERGYCGFDEKLRRLGARILRTESPA